MVNPRWGSFQKPNQQIQEQDQELVNEVPGQIRDEEKPEGEKPQWGDFLSTTTYQGKPDPIEEEGMFGYIARNIAANASRVAEQVVGRYGNIEKFGKDILKENPWVAGPVGWAIAEWMGEDKWERLVKGPKGNQQIIPTSADLKRASQELSGGYTKPKTEGEEKFQNKIEDIASTVKGRNFTNPIPKDIALNNFLTPVAANATKDIVKDLGFGEDKADLAKLAVWLPLSLAFNVNAPKYAADLMNQGRRGFPNTLTANTVRYENTINNAGRNLLQGDPRSALAQQQLAGIRNDIATGQTSMQDLMRRYDAINAAKRDRGLFALGRSDRNAAIANINQVRDGVRNEIEHLGASNPLALKSWQNGIKAFSTIHTSNAITNWIERIAKGPYAKILTGPAAAMFGLGSYGISKLPLITGTQSAALSVSYKTGQTLYRMWSDPNLNNYYWKAISAAQAENLPAFINNYNKFNERLEKESTPITPKAKTKK